MNKQINFEDNIFMLNVRVRMLLDLMCLDVDPDLYSAKTLEDLDFIDHVLTSIYKYFAENRLFLDREDELDKLIDLEFRFDHLLAGMCRFFPAQKEQILFLKSTSETRRKSIDEIRSPQENSMSEPVVSSFEMNELLRKM